VRGEAQDLRQQARPLEKMLEAVQHHEQALVTQIVDELSVGYCRAVKPEPERSRYCRGQQAR